MPESVYGLTVCGEYIYVADDYGGVLVLRYEPPRRYVYLPVIMRN